MAPKTKWLDNHSKNLRLGQHNRVVMLSDESDPDRVEGKIFEGTDAYCNVLCLWTANPAVLRVFRNNDAAWHV